MISQVTGRIIPIIKQWQQRPLEEVYAHVMMDAIRYSLRQDGRFLKKTVHIVVGVGLDGHRDVLGLWIGENESSKFWLKVLSDIQNRGVRDILIVSVDGLPGFKEAIESIYHHARVQRCIVHMIRSSTKYLSFKDQKIFTQDLKHLYKAVN